MIVDVHTHVWERPAHIADAFIDDARRTAGNPDLEVAVDLDAHWAAMAPVDRAIVLGFRARHVGVLVPNEYVADYVSRHPEKLIGFCSVDPQDADSRRAARTCDRDAAAARAQGGADLPGRPPVRPPVRAADGGGREDAGARAHPPGNHVLRERVPGAGEPRAAAATRAAVSGTADGDRPPRSPVDRGDAGPHSQASASLQRHLRAVLPAVAVLQRARARDGVRRAGPAAVRHRLSVHHARLHHRGAPPRERDGRRHQPAAHPARPDRGDDRPRRTGLLGLDA